MTPWVPRGTETIAVSTTAHTGTGAAFVTNRTAPWQGAAQSLLGRMRPGARYACSAWVRAETTTAQTVRLTFEQRDGAGTQFIGVASATVTSNAWTFLSGTFSLEVAGTLNELIVYVEGPAAGVDLRVDNVAVVPLAGLRLAGEKSAVRFGGISGSSVNTDLPFGRVAGTDYHLAGTENALKFSSLHPSETTYSFSSADAILDHAVAHGQLSRGHTLIWHGSVPAWVSGGAYSAAQLQTIAYGHIDTVVARYRDRLPIWDVVNEAFNSDGTMRSTIWYDAPGIGYAGQGTKYIEELFKRARAADPDCELIYNDFSAETDNTKSDAIYAMAQDFTTRGVPLDGIGFQFHISTTPTLSSMRTNFQRFNDLGLNLHITELDVRVAVDANGVATPSALAAQGDTYFAVVGTALAYPRTTVVQTWGFSDRYSWVPGFYPGFGAALPLDEDFNRKPAWWALHNVLANQAETLAVADVSVGDSTALVTNPSFSAGKGRQLQANAANDFITLAAEVPYTGPYNVRVGVRKNSASGKYQFAATASPGGALVNLGAEQDTYAAATSYAEVDLGSFTFTSAGTNSFRFTVTGKNASSSDYDLTLDYLRLTPTGADGNQSAALTPIANQTVNEDVSVGPLAFAVSDRETVESALTITATSSNPTLIPAGNITITGGGPERLLVATPAANQSGVATLTVTAADAAGALTSETFTVTVNPVNDAPTISDVTNKTVNEDTATAALAVTLGDVDNALSGLMLTGTSSDTSLVPNANIVFGGSGANRTATITPASNQSGTATITLTVSDGALTASDTFVLTVTAVNDPPTIANIANQSIGVNTTPGALPFTIGDPETAAASLTLTRTSSNPTLVPPAGIAFGGSGANRTVTVTPTASLLGSATITVTVSDGVLTASDSFVLTVTGTALETWRFANFGTTANTGSAADLADPDRDGIANLLERALGLNPNTPATTGLPTTSWSHLGTDDYLTLTVIKNPAAADLTYTVEVSGDLSVWNSGASHTTILDNTPTLLRARDNLPSSGNTPRFIHLKVTQP